MLGLCARSALLEHLVENRNRVVLPTDGHVRASDSQLKIRIVGRSSKGRPELLSRLLNVAVVLEEQPALERQPLVVLVDGDDLVELGAGLFEPACPAQRHRGPEM